MDILARGKHLMLEIDVKGLEGISNERAPWNESAQDVRRGVSRGHRRAVLLAWVRMNVLLLLTPRERHCIDLYYFRGMTYRQLGAVTNTNATSAFRAVQRAIRKLKLAAEEEGVGYSRRGGAQSST